MKKLRVLLLVAVFVLVMAVGAFADYTSITTAVGTAMGDVESGAMTMIQTILPYALGILGAVLVIRIGIRVFKTVSGR